MIQSSFPFKTKAYGHICHIVNNIGPRPAGSDAEKDTLDYIDHKMGEWGFYTERSPFNYAPIPSVFYPYIIAGIYLAIVGWMITQYPWSTIILPAVFFILPAYSRLVIHHRAKTVPSTNLFGYLPKTQISSSVPTLILSAHIDTARASAFRNTTLLRLRYQTNFIVQRIAILLSILSILQIIGIHSPNWILLFSGIISSLAGIWLSFSQLWDQVSCNMQYSPGANDNASGVAILLSLAEYISLCGVFNNLKIGFLFTGAEETGLHGSDAFATSLKDASHNLYVLTLDMVGAGNDLYFIRGDGTLFPLKTDPELNNKLKSANQSIKGLWYILRSGDFASFLRHGIAASALQSGGSIKAEVSYHTIYDTLDVIELQALDNTAKTVLTLIESLEKKS